MAAPPRETKNEGEGGIGDLIGNGIGIGGGYADGNTEGIGIGGWWMGVDPSHKE